MEHALITREKTMKRRDFLKGAACGISSCCCAPILGMLKNPSLSELAISQSTPDNCYTAEQMLAYFDKYIAYEKDIWIKHYGKGTAEEILTRARDELALLAPVMPCIEDPNDSLKGSYVALAKYKAQKQHGTPLEDSAAIQYEALAYTLFNVPWVTRLLIGLRSFSKSRKEALQKRALKTQARENPDDWVFEYIEGDGRTFAYGMNYFECPVVKCFPRHDAAEFSQYICHSDDIASDAFGYGYIRTSTLAWGADKCDFRCKWTLPRFFPRKNYLA